MPHVKGRRIKWTHSPNESTYTWDYYYNVAWQVLEVRKEGSAYALKQYVWDIRYVDPLAVRFRDGNTDGDGRTAPRARDDHSRLTIFAYRSCLCGDSPVNFPKRAGCVRCNCYTAEGDSLLEGTVPRGRNTYSGGIDLRIPPELDRIGYGARIRRDRENRRCEN